jgi:hypothetical protein
MNGRAQFVFQWVLGNVVGWIFAATVGITCVGFFILFLPTEYHDEGSNSLLTTAHSILLTTFMWLSLLAVGGFFGFGQWKTSLRDLVDKWVWLVANAIAGAALILSLIAFSSSVPSLVRVESGPASGMDTSYKLTSTWLIAILSMSSLVALTVGIPQWLALRRYVFRSSLWLLIVFLATIAVFVPFILITYAFESALFSLTVISCASPLIFAAITGIGIFELMKHRTNLTS